MKTETQIETRIAVLNKHLSHLSEEQARVNITSREHSLITLKIIEVQTKLTALLWVLEANNENFSG